MSRVGKKPVSIEEGVKVTYQDGLLETTGKLGNLKLNVPSEINVEIKDNLIHVMPNSLDGKSRAKWGLVRSLLNNMVQGVSKGFEKRLELVGVGYKASVDNQYLTLSLGFSHEIKYLIPEGVAIKAEKPTILVVSGYDKQKIGSVCAEIIKLRPPEPYKGKGIKFEGQFIIRKEGKKK